LGDVRSDAEGRWAATVEREVSPGRYAVRADVVGEEGAVEERAEVRFDRVRVTLAEESRDGTVGPDGEEDQPAGLDGGPGEVYIERGDNLWRIARAIYGQGIRYTAIYDANRAQI